MGLNLTVDDLAGDREGSTAGATGGDQYRSAFMPRLDVGK